jgi:hypothetical protein
MNERIKPVRPERKFKILILVSYEVIDIADVDIIYFPGIRIKRTKPPVR